jgi:hypothetical protein
MASALACLNAFTTASTAIRAISSRTIGCNSRGVPFSMIRSRALWPIPECGAKSSRMRPLPGQGEGS